MFTGEPQYLDQDKVHFLLKFYDDSCYHLEKLTIKF